MPRVINLLRGRWYENRLFTFRDDLSARTLSRVFQFTINHIHTYKGPIKISEKQFLLLICIFLSVRNLKWFQCNCKNWNQWNYFLRKVSFLQSDNNEMNIDCFIHSIQSLKKFGHNLKMKFHFDYDSIWYLISQL